MPREVIEGNRVRLEIGDEDKPPRSLLVVDADANARSTSKPTTKPTTAAAPPSALLGALASFLPAMKRANDELEAKTRDDDGRRAVDIEHVDDPNGIRIEMVRTRATTSASTSATTERRTRACTDERRERANGAGFRTRCG